MGTYLFILNWLLFGFVLLIDLFLSPHFSVAITIGALVGGISSAGIVSWYYYRDEEPYRNERWIYNYFDKKYLVEWSSLFSVTGIVLFFSGLFWRPFWAFLGGLSMIWCLNITIEAISYQILRRIKK